ncbi:hypothetical protein D3C87_1597970 [compost metagenome]
MIKHLEGLGSGAGLFRRAAQAHEAGVEGLGVGAEDFRRVALGVHGDEQHAQLVGIGAQQVLHFQGAGQRRGADVGALGKAEEQQDGVATVVGQGARLAGFVLQLEIARGHAGQVHAVQLGGVGAAAGQGQQGQGRQQQAAPGIGRVGRGGANGRAQ